MKRIFKPENLAILVMLLLVLGLWSFAHYWNKAYKVEAQSVDRSRILDRRGNVGWSALQQARMQQQYLEALHEDLDGMKATIEDMQERHRVVAQKLEQLQSAMEASQKRADSRYRSIWAEHDKLRKTWGGCQ